MSGDQVDAALSALCGWDPSPGAEHTLVTAAKARAILVSGTADRVKFLNALRAVVGRRESIPKNKLGFPMVTDYDIVDSTASEQVEALLTMHGKWVKP